MFIRGSNSLGLKNSATSASRSFSSSSRPSSTERRVAKLQKGIPEYPYGPATLYKQSNFGLYGGKRIKFGNHVAGEFNARTPKQWKVNIHRHMLWSKSLKRFVELKVATSVLRTIDKVGGLDEYVLGSKTARIKELGITGWRLRWEVMQSRSVKERLDTETDQLRQKIQLPDQQSEMTGSVAEQALHDRERRTRNDEKTEEAANSASVTENSSEPTQQDDDLKIPFPTFKLSEVKPFKSRRKVTKDVMKIRTSPPKTRRKKWGTDMA